MATTALGAMCLGGVLLGGAACAGAPLPATFAQRPAPAALGPEAPPLDAAAQDRPPSCDDLWPLFHRPGMPPPLDAVEIGECTVVVATVAAVRDEGATQASPPTVLLQVEEVLAGALELGTVPGVWRAEPHFSMCSVGEGMAEQQWRATPMKGPAVGARFLVAGALESSGRWFVTRPALRRPFTPELREQLRAKVKAERQAGTQAR